MGPIRSFVAIALALCLIAALVPVPSAGAYVLQREGCRYDPDIDDDGLGIGFQRDNDLYDEDEELAIQYAASAWNGAMDPQFTVVNHSSFDRDLAVRWANLGPNVAGYLLTNCGSSRFRRDLVSIFSANATFYTPTMRHRKVIGIHEIGHSYGLNHNNAGGCDPTTASLMHRRTLDKYDLCGWHRPTQHSVDGATAAHGGEWQMAAASRIAVRMTISLQRGRTRLSQRHAGAAQICRVASVVALALVACTPNDSTSNEVVLSAAEHDSINDLVASSEYLVRGRVLDAANEVSIDDEAGLAYYVNRLEVQNVLAQRPGAEADIAKSDVIRTGIVLLDTSKADAISNFEDLATHYPTEVEAPAKDVDLLAFLVDTSDEAAVNSDMPSFAVVGYAIIGKDGEITWKGFPGGLAGSKTSLMSISGEILALFNAPAPWRQVEGTPGSGPGPAEGPDGRAPLSEPG